MLESSIRPEIDTSYHDDQNFQHSYVYNRVRPAGILPILLVEFDSLARGLYLNQQI